IWLLGHVPTSKVSTYAYVNPVVAVFLGWLILHEPITAYILAGSAIVVASVALVTSAEVKTRTSTEQVQAIETAWDKLTFHCARLQRRNCSNPHAAWRRKISPRIAPSRSAASALRGIRFRARLQPRRKLPLSKPLSFRGPSGPRNLLFASNGPRPQPKGRSTGEKPIGP